MGYSLLFIFTFIFILDGKEFGSLGANPSLANVDFSPLLTRVEAEVLQEVSVPFLERDEVVKASINSSRADWGPLKRVLCYTPAMRISPPDTDTDHSGGGSSHSTGWMNAHRCTTAQKHNILPLSPINFTSSQHSTPLTNLGRYPKIACMREVL